MPEIACKRIYAPPSEGDGFRVLIDRLWPRGLSKAETRIELWAKTLAPSTALREQFSHRPERWPAFCQAYSKELDDNEADVRALLSAAAGRRITLLYAARDEQHNNARALQQYLRAFCRGQE